MQLTLIPSSAHGGPIAFVMPISAVLLIEYGAISGKGAKPAIELIINIEEFLI